MIYITTRQNTEEKQLNWMDIINGIEFNTNLGTNGTPGTITRCYESIPEQIKSRIYVNDMIETLKRFNENHKELIATDKKTLYRHFKIPKAKGGFRDIDDPCAELRLAHNELVYILAEKFGLLYHTSAYAYIEKRSTTQCVRKHQNGNNNWFFLTDFSGFFPNTTIDFVMRMLSMVFPLSEVCAIPEGYDALKKAISLGFLNGGLPQGTSLSPMLTNIMMIPIDHKLFNELAHKKYTYTRYADDIQISCVQRIDKEKMTHYIDGVLKEFNAPWRCKPEKTRLINNKACTPNWILGVNLNKDNNITVGYRKKQEFKAATNNLILDYKNGNRWNIEDIQYYTGLLSYYQMVEKEYFDKVLSRFYEKYNIKVKRILKEWLSGKQ